MTRVVLTEVAAGAAEGLRKVLGNSDDMEIIGYARDGLEAAQMAIQLQPDALLVHRDLPGISGYDVCRLVSVAAPEVGCILLEEDESEKSLRAAMQAGARAILARDSDVQRLLQTLRQMQDIKAIRDTSDYQLATDPAKMPATIGLISAKDGVGKTTIAVNLATTVAQRFPDQVVLVDYYAHLGDVDLCLNIDPRNSLVDLASFASDLDADMVEAALIRHDSGLRVLAGCSVLRPVWLDAINVPYIATLLGILRRHYRFAFCELPPLLWPASLYTLSRCQQVIVVTNLFDLPTVRDTATLVNMLLAGYVGRDRVKLVVNRASRRDAYPVTDLEEATGQKISFELPNDSQTVVSAFNKGTPFVIGQPSSIIARAIEQMADALLAELTNMQSEPVNASKGLDSAREPSQDGDLT